MPNDFIQTVIFLYIYFFCDHPFSRRNTNSRKGGLESFKPPKWRTFEYIRLIEIIKVKVIQINVYIGIVVSGLRFGPIFKISFKGLGQTKNKSVTEISCLVNLYSVQWPCRSSRSSCWQ